MLLVTFFNQTISASDNPTSTEGLFKKTLEEILSICEVEKSHLTPLKNEIKKVETYMEKKSAKIKSALRDLGNTLNDKLKAKFPNNKMLPFNVAIITAADGYCTYPVICFRIDSKDGKFSDEQSKAIEELHNYIIHFPSKENMNLPHTLLIQFTPEQLKPIISSLSSKG